MDTEQRTEFERELHDAGYTTLRWDETNTMEGVVYAGGLADAETYYPDNSDEARLVEPMQYVPDELQKLCARYPVNMSVVGHGDTCVRIGIEPSQTDEE